MPKFEIGDTVLALNLREGPKWLIGTIVQKEGINVFSILIHKLNTTWRRHSNQLLSTSPSIDNVEEPIIQDSSTDNILDNTSASQTNFRIPPNYVIPNTQVEEELTENDPQYQLLRRSNRPKKPVVRYGFD